MDHSPWYELSKRSLVLFMFLLMSVLISLSRWVIVQQSRSFQSKTKYCFTSIKGELLKSMFTYLLRNFVSTHVSSPSSWFCSFIHCHISKYMPLRFIKKQESVTLCHCDATMILPIDVGISCQAASALFWDLWAWILWQSVCWSKLMIRSSVDSYMLFLWSVLIQ